MTTVNVVIVMIPVYMVAAMLNHVWIVMLTVQLAMVLLTHSVLAVTEEPSSTTLAHPQVAHVLVVTHMKETLELAHSN
jgi:hypothetical protein